MEIEEIPDNRVDSNTYDLQQWIFRGQALCVLIAIIVVAYLLMITILDTASKFRAITLSRRMRARKLI